jgi:golgi to ER traffic protein 4
MANIKSNRGINRVLEKITKSFESGNFYESHQLYKTLYFRYSAQGKLPEILGVFFLDFVLFYHHFDDDKYLHCL